MSYNLRTKLLHKWQETLSIHRWVAFVLPFAVFMLIGSMEPTDPESPNYRFYPWIYGVKLLLTAIALRLVWPVYRPLLRPVGWHGIAVGTLGAVLWIGICHLKLESTYLFPLAKQIGLDQLLGSQTRSAFNPFIQLAGFPVAIGIYLLVRGIGLALIVPIIEEHFLRAFLMRFVVSEKWWKYPIGAVTRNSALIGTLVPMLLHPGELIAAAIWFSMVTILYARTKNLWECIAAHCTTNLLMGIYVVIFGAWELV